MVHMLTEFIIAKCDAGSVVAQAYLFLQIPTMAILPWPFPYCSSSYIFLIFSRVAELEWEVFGWSLSHTPKNARNF